MIRLKFDRHPEAGLRVLCLGAHSDDIEIGCGGTILRLIAETPGIEIDWVVLSALGERGEEARRSADEFLMGAARVNVIVKDFKDGYFPSKVEPLKDIFEELKSKVSPDLIFTHYRNDLHQDHRQLCELTWNTWRDHFILEYEIPKYDGDLASPNFFVPLQDDIRARKIDLLLRHFQTQNNKHWFSPETFNALLRLRGVENRSPSGYAEAFHTRKIVF
jgi:LmbE family N-acetylglucosaminyl deacetylase